MALLDDEETGAAFGFFPQMQPRRRLQDVQGSANLPVDVTRGRLAGLLGLIPDVLNFMGRSPMPTETFGETQYEPRPQLPYDTDFYLKNLPLAPTSRAGQVAGQAASFVPLNPAPAARALGAGAKALGPTAAGMTEGYLQRQGLIMPLDVYHGTPHTLPPTARNPLGEFDASKIGTGEGAQSYGYGIYTAEAPATAMEYQKQLGTQMRYKGQQFYDPIVGRKTATTGNPEIDDYLLSYLGDTGVVRKELLNAAKEMRASKNPQALKQYQTLMSEFRKIRPDVTAANTGNLYKADLPDEMIPKMLDYDKPLSKQDPYVRDIIAKAFPSGYINGKFVDPLNSPVTGRAMLDQLNMIANQRNEPGFRSAETALRQAGIPGIKYLDEASRAKGKGTRNFVTFPGEEKNLRILERNGLLGD